jgi:putative ABC transport system permease protein
LHFDRRLGIFAEEAEGGAMLSDLVTRLRALFQRSVVETELDDELRFHFEQQVEKFTRAGLSPEQARRQARLEFGGDDQIKEECRDARGVHFVEILAQDVRYGFRMLAKNWKVAGIAAFSLAVAMSLSVVGISVLNGVLLRPPLAVAPDRLVTIYTSTPSHEFEDVSYAEYLDYRTNSRSFSALAAFPNQISKIRVTHHDRDELLTMESASDNYFSVMGIQPFLGQLFRAGDDAAKASSVVLNYSCWKRWGADPNIVGQTLTLNRQVFTIVGVAPQAFTGTVFGFNVDIFMSLASNTTVFRDAQSLNDRSDRWLFLLGRLQPGVSRQAARAELRTLSAQLAAAYPETNKDRVAVLTPTSVLAPDARATGQLISGVLIAIVLLVLLIACANVANLLLGLATGRKQEILIRSALGATRGRLIRQLLTESVLLCAVGGVIGFLLASAVLARFAQFSTSIPILGSFDLAANFRTDGMVAIMTMFLILVASLATGITPALYASEPNVSGALSGESVVGGTRKGFIRSALVVIQIAVCTLVVCAVGVSLRSLHNLQNVDLGFSARNLVGVLMYAPPDGLSEIQVRQLHERIRESAAQLYGVQSRSLALEFPLFDENWPTDDVVIQNGTGPAQKPVPIPSNVVDGDYFATLGIPFLAGRSFGPADTEKNPEVVVVSHSLAETYWPGADPIGKQIHMQKPDRVVTVVGVVGDSKYNTLDEQVHPVMYYALSQHYQAGVVLIVRTTGRARLWIQPVDQLARNLGIKLDVPPFTLDDVMRFTLLIPLVTLSVVVILGALAMMLAILGLYGAVFYSVNERRREIGIRVALGAEPFHLFKMFLGQTAIVSGIGIALGILLGVTATILFRAQFYRISAIEPRVLLPVAVIMMLISLSIAYAAARPWIRINPMDAVRHT